jgi:hypothetical protein
MLLVMMLVELFDLARPTTLRAESFQGRLTKNTVWRTRDHIEVTGEIQVPYGRTLTIEPGTVVRFTGPFSIKVEGTLVAQGTAEKNIVFTSTQDPRYLAHDPNKTVPVDQPAAWGGILLTGNRQQIPTQLTYVVMRYCGASTRACLSADYRQVGIRRSSIQYSRTAGISLWQAAGTIEESRIAHAAQAAIEATAGTITVSGNRIEKSGSGLNINGAAATIENNRIEQNQGWAIYFDKAAFALPLKANTIHGNGAAARIPASAWPQEGDTNLFTGNRNNQIWILGNERKQNLTLNIRGRGTSDEIRAYRISGMIKMGAETELKVAPGVILKFDDDAGIETAGALTVVGEAGASIIMTSTSDQRYFPDLTDSFATGWRGIHLISSSKQAPARFAHFMLLYTHNAEAGAALWIEGRQRVTLEDGVIAYHHGSAVKADHSRLTAQRCEIFANGGHGFDLSHGRAVRGVERTALWDDKPRMLGSRIERSRIFANQGDAIHYEGFGLLELTSNELFGNRGMGLVAPLATITSYDNFWGSAWGPRSIDQARPLLDTSSLNGAVNYDGTPQLHRRYGTEFSYFGDEPLRVGRRYQPRLIKGQLQPGHDGSFMLGSDGEIALAYSHLDADKDYAVIVDFRVEQRTLYGSEVLAVTDQNGNALYDPLQLQRQDTSPLIPIPQALYADGKLTLKLQAVATPVARAKGIWLIERGAARPATAALFSSSSPLLIQQKDGVLQLSMKPVPTHRPVSRVRVKIDDGKKGQWYPASFLQADGGWAFNHDIGPNGLYTFEAELLDKYDRVVARSERARYEVALTAIAAASQVNGHDFASDEGGKIAIFWQLSPDDGKGSHTVEHYVIERRAPAEPEFTTVGEVPAGKGEYRDDKVVDGKPYQYRVITRDRAGRSMASAPSPWLYAFNNREPHSLSSVAPEKMPIGSLHAAGGDQMVLLKWEQMPTARYGITALRLEMSAEDAQADSSSSTVELKPWQREYVFTGLKNSIRYRFNLSFLEGSGKRVAAVEVKQKTGIAPLAKVGGTLKGSTIWSEGTYQLSEDLLIEKDSTLTILPGSIIKVAPGKKIVVKGELFAAGSAVKPILFTSIYDRNDPSQHPAELEGRHWDGIYFEGAAPQATRLSHVILRYGGHSKQGAGMLNSQNRSLELSDVQLTQSEGHGLICDGEQFVIENSQIRHSRGAGIYVKSARQLLLKNSQLEANSNGMTVESGTARLENNRFQANLNYGLFYRSAAAAVTLLHNRFDNNNRPLRIPAGSLFDETEGNELKENRHQQVELLGSSLQRTITLSPAQAYHLVQGEFEIAPTYHLKLRPGTIFTFAAATGITVRGALDARGTSEQPILFTSVHDSSLPAALISSSNATAQAGDWRGITFENSAMTLLSALQQVKIRYAVNNIKLAATGLTMESLELAHAGKHGLWSLQGSATLKNSVVEANGDSGILLEGGSAQLQDVTIRNNNQDGVNITAPTALVMQHNQIIGNRHWGINFNQSGGSLLLKDNRITDNEHSLRIPLSLYPTADDHNQLLPNRRSGIWLLGDERHTDLVLGKFTDPAGEQSSRIFVFEGESTLARGTTMTIEPNIVLKMEQSSGLTIKGRLIAKGQASAPIIVTSYRDDEFAGDTNSDGNRTTPAAGDWHSLRLEEAQGSELAYLMMRYGGAAAGMLTLLRQPELKLAHLQLAHAASEALTAIDSELILDESEILASTSGATIIDSRLTRVRESRIYANRKHGLMFLRGTDIRIKDSAIMGNLEAGVKAVNCLVDARANWWGAPLHVNDNLQGQADRTIGTVKTANYLTEGPRFSYFNRSTLQQRGTLVPPQLGAADPNGSSVERLTLVYPQTSRAADYEAVVTYSSSNPKAENPSRVMLYDGSHDPLHGSTLVAAHRSVTRLAPLINHPAQGDALHLTFGMPQGQGADLNEIWLMERPLLEKRKPATLTLTAPQTNAHLGKGEVIIRGRYAAEQGCATCQIELLIEGGNYHEQVTVQELLENGAFQHSWQPLQSGTYHISALARSGDGPAVHMVGNITAHIDLDPPVALNSLYAHDRAGDRGGAITLDWKDPATSSAVADISRIVIERRSAKNPAYTTLATLPPTARDYVDKSAVNGDIYEYRIVTVDAKDNHTIATSSGPVVPYDNHNEEILSKLTSAERRQLINFQRAASSSTTALGQAPRAGEGSRAPLSKTKETGRFASLALVGDIIPPEDSTNFSASSSSAAVTLNWDASSNSEGDLAAQLLDFSTDNGATWGTLTGGTFTPETTVNLPINQLSHVQTDLTDGTAYMFRLRMQDLNGNISQGVIVSATPSSSSVTPIAIEGSSLTISDNSHVTWGPGLYWVKGSLTIDAGSSLTLAPGTIVKMDLNQRITVNGTLNAMGTATAAPIIITSITDDAHGGDTNGDGSNTRPTDHDWGDILFYSTGSSLNYVQLLHAGASGWALDIEQNGGLTINSCQILGSIYTYYASDILIENSFISSPSRDAIQYNGAPQSTLILRGNRIVGSNMAVAIFAGSAILQNNTIQHNDLGVYAEFYQTPSLTLTGNTITQNRLGLSLPLDQVPAPDAGNTLAPNDRNAIEVRGMEITRDMTLAGNLTYLFHYGNVNIPTSRQLTIEGGAILKFNSLSFNVYGKLQSNGTADAPVIFTSYRDDTAGSDSNGDGNSVAAAGDWYGLSFSDSQGSKLTHTRIHYGSTGLQSVAYAPLADNSDELALDHVDIRYSSNSGLSLNYGSPKVQHSYIASNGADGIYYYGASNASAYPLFSDNIITQNMDDGIHIFDASADLSRNIITDNKKFGINFERSSSFPDTPSTLIGNRIQNNLKSARIPAHSIPVESNGNILAPNAIAGLWISGNTRRTDLTLGPSSAHPESSISTYNISGTMSIEGANLNLLPGAVLKFDRYAGLDVAGTLHTPADTQTPARKVVLTSIKDDLYGADTSEGENQPLFGEWYGLTLNSYEGMLSSQLNNIVIRNAYIGITTNTSLTLDQGEISNSSQYGYGIYFYAYDNSKLTISNSLIYGNSGTGIYIYGGDQHSIQNSRIFANKNDGIGAYFFSSSATAAINGCEIYGNIGNGLALAGAGSIDAERNWWGSETGPGGSGTTQGDTVSVTSGTITTSNHLTSGSDILYYAPPAIQRATAGFAGTTVTAVPSSTTGVETTTYTIAPLNMADPLHLTVAYQEPSGFPVIQNMTEGSYTIQPNITVDGQYGQLSFALPKSLYIEPADRTLSLAFNARTGTPNMAGFWLSRSAHADTTAPLISITSPTHGQGVASSGTMVTGTYSDESGSAVKVELGISDSQGTQLWQTATNLDSSGNWSTNWIPASMGSYTLHARAIDQAGNETTTSGIAVVVANAPAPVTLLSANGTASGILLSWNRSFDDGNGDNNVSGYDIYRATLSDSLFSKIGSTGAGSEEYQDNAVAGGSYYRYFVRTIGRLGVYQDSTTVGPVKTSMVSDTTPPDDVTALTVEATQRADGNVTAQLGWSSSAAPDLYRYSLYISKDGGNHWGSNSPDYNDGIPQLISSNSTSILLNDLAAQTIYIFKLTASDFSGNESSGTSTSLDTGTVTSSHAISLRAISNSTELTGGLYTLTNGSVEITSGTVLTIRAGTVLKFAPGASLDVHGNLIVDGNSGNPVVFTSIYDDSVFADGDAATASRGSWNGIVFFSEADPTVSKVSYAKIKYAGSSGAALRLDSTAVPVTGSEISFNRSAGIEVSNSTASITQTHIHDNGWAGISILGIMPAGASKINIEECILAGHTYGIYAGAHDLQLTRNMLRNNSYGIYFEGSYDDPTNHTVMTENNLYDNSYPARIPVNALFDSTNTIGAHTNPVIFLEGGTVDHDVTLRAVNKGAAHSINTYVIDGGDITIAPTATVTVEPGLYVKFKGFIGLTVNGNLTAAGTSSEPIIFTSAKDDLAGGFNASPRGDLLPQRGDWKGMTFESSSSPTLLRHLAVRYAASAGIWVKTRHFTLENSEIMNSSGSGIIFENADQVSISGSKLWGHRDWALKANGYTSLTITGSEFTTNHLGALHIAAGGASEGSTQIHENRILMNGFGLKNDSGNMISATGNYWGGSDGSGDGVSGLCDTSGAVTATPYTFGFFDFGLQASSKGPLAAPTVISGTADDSWNINGDDNEKTILSDPHTVSIKLHGLEVHKSYRLRVVYANGLWGNYAQYLRDGNNSPLHSLRTIAYGDMPSSYEFPLPIGAISNDGEVLLNFTNDDIGNFVAVANLVLFEDVSVAPRAHLMTIAYNDRDGNQLPSAGDELHFTFSAPLNPGSITSGTDLASQHLVTACNPESATPYGANTPVKWANNNQLLIVTLTENPCLTLGSAVTVSNLTDAAGVQVAGNATIPLTDTIAPQLLALDWIDSDDSGMISAGDKYKFHFNEVMQSASSEGSTTFANSSLPPAGYKSYGDNSPVNWENEGRTAVVTISSGFTLLGNETVTPAGTAVDRAGNLATGTVTLKGQDTTPPTIVSINYEDANKSGDLDCNDQYTFLFSEPMRKADLDPATNATVVNQKLKPGNSIWGTSNMVLWSEDQKALTIYLTAGCTITGSESITVGPDFRDLGGNQLASTNLKLTTIDSSPAQLIAVTSNYLSPLAPTDNLILTFEFDAPLNTSSTPTITLTSNGSVRATAPQGSFTTRRVAGDTYVTGPITLTADMAGQLQVNFQNLLDSYGNHIPDGFNVLTLALDGSLSQNFTRVISSTTTINSANPLSPNERLLVQGAGVQLVLAAGVHQVKALHLRGGAQLVAAAPAVDTNSPILELSTEELNIDADSAIDLNGMGLGPRDDLAPGAGGAHGGSGDSATPPALDAAFGDYLNPLSFGLGGKAHAADSPHSRGGGALKLTVQRTLTVNGIIRSDGSLPGEYVGGAAGGSLLITTQTLAGSGKITANGSDSLASNDPNRVSYGGGGGRVALIYQNVEGGFDPLTQIEAKGGRGGLDFSRSGGAGTIYLQQSNAPSRLVLRSSAASGGFTLLSGVYNCEILLDSSLVYLAANTQLISLEGLNKSQNNNLVVALGSFTTASGNFKIDAYTLQAAEALNFTQLEILNNGVLTLSLAATAEASLAVTASQLSIDVSSSIDMSGKGALATSAVSMGSGGSYGGPGGYVAPGETNPLYGEYRTPALPGTGGAGYESRASRGGGAIKLAISGTLDLQGKINANGEDGAVDAAIGGGSGGSVWINVGTLSGNGSISASGGSTSSHIAGKPASGGGGGRIAVYFNTLSGFDLQNHLYAFGGQVNAPNGGVAGGGGTVYWQNKGDNSDALLVTNSYGDPANANVVHLAGVYPSLLSMKRANIVIDDANFNEVQLQDSIVYIKGGATIRGSYDFSRSRVVVDGQLMISSGNLTVSDYLLDLADRTYNFNTLTVTQDGKITAHITKADTPEPLELMANNITVGSGSSIDLSRLALKATGVGAGSGGSYGGLGGTVSQPTNATYGNFYEPLDYGRAGLAIDGQQIARAGGVLKLTALQTLQLDGALKAEGGSGPNSAGGGSGGSIWITAQTLRVGSGDSLISARGGDGNNGPGGGGGRVAISYQNFDGPDLYKKVDVAGGLRSGAGLDGAAGSVYVEDKGLPLAIRNIRFKNPDAAEGGTIVVEFAKEIDEGSFTVSALHLQQGESPIAVSRVTKVARTQYEIKIAQPLAVGRYSFTIDRSIKDVSGAFIDQNGDGKPGEESDGFTSTLDLRSGGELKVECNCLTR